MDETRQQNCGGRARIITTILLCSKRL